MAEITRKSVLMECLSIMREEQRICSKGYNCLEPADGMEEAWEQDRRKITILQEIIQALDSEPVLRAMANWQKEEMPPRNIAEGFTDQPSAVARDSSTTPAAPVGMTANTDEIRVTKISDDFRKFIEEMEKGKKVVLPADAIEQEKPMIIFSGLDHEDGTMELR